MLLLVDPKMFQITLMPSIFHKKLWLWMILKEDMTAVLHLSCVNNITIVNSKFSDNDCTLIAGIGSIFHLQKTVEFYSNTSYSGGALAFHCNTNCDSTHTERIGISMMLNPHTSAYIINNTQLVWYTS